MRFLAMLGMTKKRRFFTAFGMIFMFFANLCLCTVSRVSVSFSGYMAGSRFSHFGKCFHIRITGERAKQSCKTHTWLSVSAYNEKISIDCVI